MQRKHMAALVAGIMVLLVGTATASAFITRENFQDEKPAVTNSAKKETISWDQPARPAPQPVQQAPACDDNNIVGTVIGGLAGGVGGSQIGSGSGKTAATIGGTLGGAYLGNEYIPTRNVTCR